jgi:hypothetical protein
MPDRPAIQLLLVPRNSSRGRYSVYLSARLKLRGNNCTRVHFCGWFLQSLIEGEINLQLTFFSDEAWFHLQQYINTQNNRYWSSQNPHLTHEVPRHPVKVGVWCAVSARRFAVPVF